LRCLHHFLVTAFTAAINSPATEPSPLPPHAVNRALKFSSPMTPRS